MIGVGCVGGGGGSVFFLRGGGVGHGLVMFLTGVEISIVQVGVLLRLCFKPTITYVALGEIAGGADKFL